MLLIGHVLDKLAELPAESVQCVVTSPPYWGLRDYSLEPVVWGGRQGCEHEWSPSIEPGGQGSGKSFRRDRKAGRKRGGLQIGFCRFCGAWSGQLGLEPTPEQYIQHLVEVFREVRRVLRKDGIAWVNMGDSYANYGTGGNGATGGLDKVTLAGPMPPPGTTPTKKIVPPGLKPKDLTGMPWRLSFALQADGWWLRSRIIEEVEFYCPCGCGYIMEERIWRYDQDREIIWKKPNPMPESVTDRPTSSHESIFLLTKAARYFYDAEAVREPAGPTTKMPDGWATHKGDHGSFHRDGREKGKKWPGIGPQHAAARDRGEKYEPMATHAYRNQRDVWTIATQSFVFELCLECRTLYRNGWRGLNIHIDDEGNKHAICRICDKWDRWFSHFATFPEKIPKRAILAGTSAKGCCPDCGAPWERVVEKEFVSQPDVSPERGRHNAAGNKSMEHRKDGDTSRGSNMSTTASWRPTCEHPGDPIPCTVLDPFAGSGTVGKVATELGREYILIEQSEDCAELIRGRTATTMGLVL